MSCVLGLGGRYLGGKVPFGFRRGDAPELLGEPITEKRESRRRHLRHNLHGRFGSELLHFLCSRHPDGHPRGTDDHRLEPDGYLWGRRADNHGDR